MVWVRQKLQVLLHLAVSLRRPGRLINMPLAIVHHLVILTLTVAHTTYFQPKCKAYMQSPQT